MTAASRRTQVWSGRRMRAAEAQENTGNTRTARRRIIARHARTECGHVLVCLPTRDELAGRAPRWPAAGSTGKVIYPSMEAAQAAARELQAIGAEPQYAYVCPRSQSGHAHLTRAQ